MEVDMKEFENMLDILSKKIESSDGQLSIIF